MTKTLRNRLTLLGTTSLFAVALVAAPIQFSSVTPDLAIAHAGEHGDQSDDQANEGGGNSQQGVEGQPGQEPPEGNQD